MKQYLGDKIEIQERHVASMVERRGAYRVIMRWIFRNCERWARTGLIWLRIGTAGGQ